MGFSSTQLDKLGQRLKAGPPSDDDLRMLDEYRRSFEGASSAVIRVLRDEMSLSPTARPAKSTTAIVDKLRREKARLTQIQDIAGCRVIVSTLAVQRNLLEDLVKEFPDSRHVDRLAAPSHGYRAQHLIVKIDGRLVEIQIRTELQHLWAALSEKVADRHGHGIKYGIGPTELLKRLDELSQFVRQIEAGPDLLELLKDKVDSVASPDLHQAYAEAVELTQANRRILLAHLTQLVANPDNLASDEK